MTSGLTLFRNVFPNLKQFWLANEVDEEKQKESLKLISLY